MREAGLQQPCSRPDPYSSLALVSVWCLRSCFGRGGGGVLGLFTPELRNCRNARAVLVVVTHKFGQPEGPVTSRLGAPPVCKRDDPVCPRPVCAERTKFRPVCARTAALKRDAPFALAPFAPSAPSSVPFAKPFRENLKKLPRRGKHGRRVGRRELSPQQRGHEANAPFAFSFRATLRQCLAIGAAAHGGATSIRRSGTAASSRGVPGRRHPPPAFSAGVGPGAGSTRDGTKQHES